MLTLPRVFAPTCVTLAVMVSTLPFCATRAADVPNDLGVSADVQQWRVQFAVQNIAKDCPNGDLQILYYVDGSQPGLFKVRTRSKLGVILDTRIFHLMLSDWSRSYAGAAIGPIAYGTDVARAAGSLGARVPLPPEASVDIGVPIPPKHIPPSTLSLPRAFEGVTVEQALDQEAEAFRGIATVGFCEKPRLIEFELTNALPP